MDKLADLEEAEAKVLNDMRQLVACLRGLSAEIESLRDGVLRLQSIRTTVYENLNQIQHEYLVLQGIQWLKNACIAVDADAWYWNPRQTGDATEPDLKAQRGACVLLSAEATTSEQPQGVLDTRMRDTLARLDAMDGRKFYFVRTEAMAKRARTKVARNSWHIEVVQIEL